MLTVAIPTYNRSRQLAGLLDELANQLVGSTPGDWQILVSDNASTDDTEMVVRERMRMFEEKGARLDYRVNASNLGYSRNVDAVVTAAAGEYVLLMGDDDGLEPGSLSYLMNLLTEHPDASLVFLGNVAYDPDLSAPLSASPKSWTEHVFQDGLDYLRSHHGFPPALLSGYVVRRSAWVAAHASDFAYSISIHMLTATRMMCHHAVVIDSGRSSIRYRTDQPNATWSKDPLYPFRFYLDELRFLEIVHDEMASDVARCLVMLAQRVLAFYLLRQKVLAHVFDEHLFYETYDGVRTPCNRYSVLIACIRRMPRWVLSLPYHCIPAHIRSAGI